MTNRHSSMMTALRSYRSAPVELRAQRLDAWLAIATGAEVRRYWRDWMGTMPGWAIKAL